MRAPAGQPLDDVRAKVERLVDLDGRHLEAQAARQHRLARAIEPREHHPGAAAGSVVVVGLQGQGGLAAVHRPGIEDQLRHADIVPDVRATRWTSAGISTSSSVSPPCWPIRLRHRRVDAARQHHVSSRHRHDVADPLLERRVDLPEVAPVDELAASQHERHAPPAPPARPPGRPPRHPAATYRCRARGSPATRRTPAIRSGFASMSMRCSVGQSTMPWSAVTTQGAPGNERIDEPAHQLVRSLQRESPLAGCPRRTRVRRDPARASTRR